MERETAEINEGEGLGFSDPVSLTLPSSPEYVLLARLVVSPVGRLAGFGLDSTEGGGTRLKMIRRASEGPGG